MKNSESQVTTYIPWLNQYTTVESIDIIHIIYSWYTWGSNSIQTIKPNCSLKTMFYAHLRCKQHDYKPRNISGLKNHALCLSLYGFKQHRRQITLSKAGEDHLSSFGNKKISTNFPKFSFHCVHSTGLDST